MSLWLNGSWHCLSTFRVTPHSLVSQTTESVLAININVIPVSKSLIFFGNLVCELERVESLSDSYVGVLLDNANTGYAEVSCLCVQSGHILIIFRSEGILLKISITSSAIAGSLHTLPQTLSCPRVRPLGILCAFSKTGIYCWAHWSYLLFSSANPDILTVCRKFWQSSRSGEKSGSHPRGSANPMYVIYTFKHCRYRDLMQKNSTTKLA